MPVRANIESAIFVGVHKGRPRFDFGDHTAAPDWLIKLTSSGKIDGQQFVVAGKILTPGDEVTKAWAP